MPHSLTGNTNNSLDNLDFISTNEFSHFADSFPSPAGGKSSQTELRQFGKERKGKNRRRNA